MPQTPHTQPLTTDAFLAAVRAAAPQVAVFDFDGTLWPGDAGTGFMHWTVRTGLLEQSRATWILDRHRSYHRGEVDETTMCGEMVQIYRGLSERSLRESASAYFRAEVEPHLYPVMVGLVRELRENGTELWAVSSTNNWVIEAAVQELGIGPAKVLAACTATADGTATEELLDIPSDEGKAIALRRVAVTPDAVFGNSIHDAAMLQLARFPFAVNPNAGLQKHAAQAGWPMYFPESLTYQDSHGS